MAGLPTEALRFANSVRRQLKLDPQRSLQPGAMREAGSCPIANTIKAGTDYDVAVSPYGVWVGKDLDTMIDGTTPDGAASFMEKFDAKGYPALVR